jgi:aldose 1-epimerase
VADGETRPLIAGYPEDQAAHHGAGQILLPWANRVAAGRYTFDGDARQLDLSEPAIGNAIHGLTRWLPWRVAEHTADSVRLELSLFPHPGYPHTLELAVQYRVGTDGLAVGIYARNTGVHPAPYGFGAHPYITPGVPPEEGRADEWTLHLPAERYLAVDERMIPCGGFDVDSSPYDFRKPDALWTPRSAVCNGNWTVSDALDSALPAAAPSPSGSGADSSGYRCSQATRWPGAHGARPWRSSR